MSLEITLSVLKDYLKTSKDLGMLLTGSGSYINCYNPKTHRLHGRVDSIGANTGRMTHYHPNLTQLSKDRAFRELLSVPKGKVLVDVDADALELVMLGHYLGEFDNYKFAIAVDSGKKEDGTDIHTINQRMCNLSTRDQSKRLVYASIYGAGATKIGCMLYDSNTVVKYTSSEFNDEYHRLLNRTIELDGKRFYPVAKNTLAPFDDELVVKSIFGNKTLDLFKKGTDGYFNLLDKITGLAEEGNLIGLDGRVLNVRRPSSALNLLLQSAGAIFMKYLLVNVEKEMSKYYTYNKEYMYVANIHDCINMEIIPSIKDRVNKILIDSFAKTSKELGLKYPVKGVPKFGKTQYDTH